MAIMTQAIVERNQRNRVLKAAKNPTAKIESRARVDEDRRRARVGMRKHRASKPGATTSSYLGCAAPVSCGVLVFLSIFDCGPLEVVTLPKGPDETKSDVV